MFQLNKNSILVGVAVLAIIVTGCLLLININPNAKALLLGFGMSGETVANNAVAYINQNLLQEGQTASLESFSEESGIIKIKVNVNGKSYNSYVTKDGKFLFPTDPIPMEAKTNDESAQAEAQENLRQICVRDEQRSKYWDYVSCQMEKGDTAGCQESTGINATKLNGCMSDANRRLSYAKEDFDLTAKYGIEGSPTVILNGVRVSEFDFGGRSSDAIKTLICNSSTTPSEFCSTTLNTQQAATSFSLTYAGATPSASANTNSANTNCAPTN